MTQERLRGHMRGRTEQAQELETLKARAAGSRQAAESADYATGGFDCRGSGYAAQGWGLLTK